MAAPAATEAGTDDVTYLHTLEAVLPKVVAHKADLIVYLAGADPFEDDQLGNLRLSKEGLRQRGRLVLHTISRAVAPVLSDGLGTAEVALHIQRSRHSRSSPMILCKSSGSGAENSTFRPSRGCVKASR